MSSTMVSGIFKLDQLDSRREITLQDKELGHHLIRDKEFLDAVFSVRKQKRLILLAKDEISRDYLLSSPLKTEHNALIRTLQECSGADPLRYDQDGGTVIDRLYTLLRRVFPDVVASLPKMIYVSIGAFPEAHQELDLLALPKLTGTLILAGPMKVKISIVMSVQYERTIDVSMTHKIFKHDVRFSEATTVGEARDEILFHLLEAVAGSLDLRWGHIPADIMSTLL